MTTKPKARKVAESKPKVKYGMMEYETMKPKNTAAFHKTQE